MTFAPSTFAPMINANLKHKPNPNPNLKSLPYPVPKTQSLPSLSLFAVGDIIAGAIVAGASVGSPPMHFSL